MMSSLWASWVTIGTRTSRSISFTVVFLVKLMKMCITNISALVLGIPDVLANPESYTSVVWIQYSNVRLLCQERKYCHQKIRCFSVTCKCTLENRGSHGSVIDGRTYSGSNKLTLYQIILLGFERRSYGAIDSVHVLARPWSAKRC